MFVNSASNTVATNSQVAEQSHHDVDPIPPKTPDFDTESVSSSSSSIATVKSEQRNSDDEDDEAHASQAEHNGEF
jgi:hypothetical protein